MIPKGDTKIEPGDLIYVLLPSHSLGEFLIFVNPDTKKPKKAIIYGASNTGIYITKSLPDGIKDVILIEENEEKAEDVADHLEKVQVIHGSATEADILTECGIEAADVFVAASNNDNSNLISSVLAKRMGAKTTLIITQQADYISLIDALDVDVIVNPQILAIEQILRLVRGKGISSVTKFLECDAEAVEFIPEPGSAVTKSPLKDIKFPKNSIVGAVYSGSEVNLANGNTKIKEGEKVVVFCEEAAIKKLQSLFTKKKLI